MSKIRYFDSDILESVAYGSSQLPDIPEIHLSSRLSSMRRYLQAVFVYRRSGFVGSRAFLESIAESVDPIVRDDDPASIRLALRQVTGLRVLGRLVGETDLCIPRTVSLTAGLIELGIPAKMVLGKAVSYSNRIYNFHSWAAIADTPIGEPETVRALYSVLAVIPGR